MLQDNNLIWRLMIFRTQKYRGISYAYAFYIAQSGVKNLKYGNDRPLPYLKSCNKDYEIYYFGENSKMTRVHDRRSKR